SWEPSSSSRPSSILPYNLGPAAGTSCSTACCSWPSFCCCPKASCPPRAADGRPSRPRSEAEDGRRKTEEGRGTYFRLPTPAFRLSWWRRGSSHREPAGSAPGLQVLWRYSRPRCLLDHGRGGDDCRPDRPQR